jgi:branched-chain amino acid aminotransferase
MRLGELHGWPVHETPLHGDELAGVDELWLTNALIGVRPVRAIGNRPLPSSLPQFESCRAQWRQTYGWDPAH